ncbi:unnamed protein product, partial [Prorocentrum cordatum]
GAPAPMREIRAGLRVFMLTSLFVPLDFSMPRGGLGGPVGGGAGGFEKYNAVCRGGPLQGEPSRVMHARFLGLCGGPGAAAAGDGGQAAVANRYTTTIHVLASALVKASKMSKVCTVMRGTTGGRLPERFWREDESGVRGGIEFGFMSTTTDRTVAMQYASDPTKGAGTVLEIQTGMIDKGAELSWISQYPHEKELCFPPLTSMQVLGTSVEGTVLVVSLRLNLNLTSSTIEEVIGKRHKVARDMCSNLQAEAKRELGRRAAEELRMHEAASQHGDLQSTVLRRLEGELGAICSNEADSFNNDSRFQAYLKDALDLKQAAVQAMGLLSGGWAQLAPEAQTVGPTLRRLLAEEGPQEAQDSLKALERLAAAQAKSRSTDVSAREAACEELAACAREGSAAADGALLLLAEVARGDSDECIREKATKALPACCERDGPERHARVLELLAGLAAEDADSDVRAAAAECLPTCCRAGGPEPTARVQELLAGLAKDPEWEVRTGAAK